MLGKKSLVARKTAFKRSLNVSGVRQPNTLLVSISLVVRLILGIESEGAGGGLALKLSIRITLSFIIQKQKS